METGESVESIQADLMFKVFIILACFVVSTLYYYTKVIGIARKFKGLPGTRFILGDCWYDSFDKYVDQVITFVQATGTKVHKVWIYFFYPVYSLNHSEVIKQILKDSFPKSTCLLGGCDPPKSLTGRSLLTIKAGNQSEKIKKLISPAFSQDHIKGYIECFNDCAEDLLIRLSKERRYTSVEITKPVSVASLDVLLRCALSYDGDLQEHGYNHFYVQAVHRLAVLLKQRVRNSLLSYDFIYKRTLQGKRFLSICHFLHGFIEERITRKIRNLIEKNNPEHKKPDYLEALLAACDEEGSGLSYTEIVGEIQSFIFKGHYSTSSALSWALYSLAKYPDIQTKVYEEVSTVIGDGEVEWDHLSQLPYMNCFIQEVLRVYTVVPVINRKLDKSTTICGVRLEPGTKVQMNLHAANQHPDVWENAKEFKPERFMDVTDCKEILEFIPFSYGARCCLGRDFTMIELKVLLSRILQTFHLELDSSHRAQPTHFLGYQSKSGIKLYIHSR